MLIKHVPEDFIVEEVPLNEWNDAGPFAVFKLTKDSLNTEQAIEIISRRFHLLSNTIKYSGTKDKHAHTIQYISMPNRQGINQIHLDEDNLKLEHVGYADEPLSLGTLKGNRFIITIRELTEKESKMLKNHKKELDKSKRFIIPNYFDEQRFSSKNYDIGLCILKKDYKSAVKYICENSSNYTDKITIYLAAHPNDYIGALQHIPKKTLMMFIHAVQSFIFNEALSRLLMENAEKKGIKHKIVQYSLGKFIFYENCSDYEGLPENLELIGFNTSSMNHHIKNLLAELSLTQRDFIVRALPDLSVDGITRESFISVQNLEIELLEKRAILEFELGKGSYATIVVKALLDN
jgi:tRNA pseudouridine13 synthase